MIFHSSRYRQVARTKIVSYFPLRVEISRELISFTADHCGISTGQVDLWNRDENLRSTALALEFLAKQFAGVKHVIGLELLNEPANDKRLPKWYQETINNIRNSTPPDFPL